MSKPETTPQLTKQEAEAIVTEHCPSLAPLDDFLGYCVIHSMSERALFNGAQIGILQLLAGDKENSAHWLRNKNQWRGVDLSGLVKEARANVA